MRLPGEADQTGRERSALVQRLLPQAGHPVWRFMLGEAGENQSGPLRLTLETAEC